MYFIAWYNLFFQLIVYLKLLGVFQLKHRTERVRLTHKESPEWINRNSLANDLFRDSLVSQMDFNYHTCLPNNLIHTIKSFIIEPNKKKRLKDLYLEHTNQLFKNECRERKQIQTFCKMSFCITFTYVHVQIFVLNKMSFFSSSFFSQIEYISI